MTGANEKANEAKAKCVWGAETVISQRSSKVAQPACVGPTKVKILAFTLSEMEPNESF